MAKLRAEIKVKLSDIDLNDTTYMSRLDFDETHINNLKEDIKKFGQRNPIGLRPKLNKYQIIYGWERTKAILLLGWETVQARVYENISDLQAQLHNISDNIKHEDLTSLEIAYQVKKLKEEFNLPIKDIAELYEGKTQYIYDLLTLIEMKEEIKRAVHLGKIGLTHAIEINKFPVSNQLEILHRAIEEGLSVGSLKTLRVGGEKKDNPTEILKVREFERLNKFILTQVDSGDDFKEGVTHENLAKIYSDGIRDSLKDKSIYTIIEWINSFIWNILYKRCFQFDKKYFTSVGNLMNSEFLIEHGWRCDEPTFEVQAWVVRTANIKSAKHCNHEWETRGLSSDEIILCKICGVEESMLDELRSMEWEDPPYEEPPKKGSWAKVGKNLIKGK